MKTQSLLRTIFGTAFIALLLSVVSCDAASNPSALVGRWVGVSGNMISGNSDKDIVIELLSDGTGVQGRNPITWKTEKDRFYITASGVAQSVSYKLQGSVLTFTEDNGKISKYTKCKKDCKETAAEYAKAEALKAAAVLKTKATKGSFTDSRDGKTYKTVKLDNQTWMAENLNYNAEGSECYESQESNCQKYGRLYNWSTAKSACPSGWHLPSVDEWWALMVFAGDYEVAGIMLKASSGWNKDGNGLDAVGFSALPSGYYPSTSERPRKKQGDRESNNVGNSLWWSSTGNVTGIGNGEGMSCNVLGDFGRYYDKSRLLSVRCVYGSIEEKTAVAEEDDSSADGLGTKAKGSVKAPSARDIDMGSGDGSRSKAEIMAVVNARMPDLRNIHNKYLKLKPGFSGKVTLKFTIAPGGDIVSIAIVSSTTGYSDFDNAVKNKVATWKWKVIKDGNTTPTITFTFT